MVLKCKSRGGFNKAFFSDAKYFRMLNAVKNNPVGAEKKKIWWRRGVIVETKSLNDSNIQ